MTSPIIISRLIEANYQVYLPISGESLIVLKCPQGALLLCETQNASDSKEGSPVARCPDDAFERSIWLAVFDKVTGSVWLLAPELMEARKNLRLGKKYEDCILPEPLAIGWKEQRDIRANREDELKLRAREAMENRL